jgi:tetratricopeptide (TPR) repeat protein
MLVLPQSEANLPHAPEIHDLVAQIPSPALAQLDCLFRLQGGFSESRIYVALAHLGNTIANRPWIIKIGPKDEIRADYEGVTLAKNFLGHASIASPIHHVEGATLGLLALDYGAYEGRPPLTLEAVMERAEAEDAARATVDAVSAWIATPTWRSCNASQWLRDCCKSRIERLPSSIQETATYRTIYSSDFGAAFSNPLYYLTRDMKRRDVRVPFGFSHGDLNLRNVLFSRTSDGTIDSQHPVFIDFSHAKADQVALYDLARLEASLRYQSLKHITDHRVHADTITFLASSRSDVALSPLPDNCKDKWLQTLWRSIRPVREATRKILQSAISTTPDVHIIYWAALIAEAIRLATYQQLPLEIRHLAYADASAIFTRHFQERESTEHFTFAAHSQFSPSVITRASAPLRAQPRLPLLVQSIQKNQALLLIGPGYGRTGGVENFLAFAQRLFNQVTKQDAPPLSASFIFESLQRNSSRQQIQKAIKERTKSWTDSDDALFATLPWTAVLNYHFHALPYDRWSASAHGDPHRVDSLGDIVRLTDEIATGARVYLPLHGDIHSVPDNLRLSAANRREAEQSLGAFSRAIEQRQASLSLVLWKCEDLSLEDLAEIRNNLFLDLTVGCDVFYMSEQGDPVRDEALRLLDIDRLPIAMSQLVEIAAAAPRADSIEDTGIDALKWSNGVQTYNLPNLQRYSRGMLRAFSGGMLQDADEREDFLLGAAARAKDIADGRVIRRRILEDSLLPSIRGLLNESERGYRAVVVSGRAGSGISTLLCHAAYEIGEEKAGPVIVADTRLARGLKEWEDAGRLLAEVSKLVHGPVILFAEATDSILGSLMQSFKACIEGGGRLVVVLGGRRESLLKNIPAEARDLYYVQVSVGDKLSRQEWLALARVLHRYGFRKEMSPADLAERMEKVGRLLPALFEATDGLNRKFRDIVAYEYSSFRHDAVVQRAYRLICTIGAFDVPMSQYWLLKALGDRGLHEARRILTALSEDIVVHAEGNGDDVQVAPLHRIIAEEVVAIATPDAGERLKDLEQLISTANMASQKQGMAVAALLYTKGPLVAWVRSKFLGRRECDERLRSLYTVALSNGPFHPQVELHIRQHFALHSKNSERFDDALSQLRRCQDLEPDNMATMHIMGMVHESRATAAWRAYAQNASPESQRRAVSDETDALEFFRNVRDARPTQEHGYESEARYYKKKVLALRSGSVPPDLERAAREQVYHGLYLLRVAEARVPKAELMETPQTRANLLGLAGDLQSAIDQLQHTYAGSGDPVQRIRLLRTIAALQMESGQWADATASWQTLLNDGERNAALYLSLDDCLAALSTPATRRADVFRDSALEYNRWDIETQIKWAELMLMVGRFGEAESALRRASDLSLDSMSVFERDRVRGILREGGARRMFAGRVARLLRQDEGYLSCPTLGRDVWFRASQELRGRLKIGDRVQFALAWRVRGLRALDVRVQ